MKKTVISAILTLLLTACPTAPAPAVLPVNTVVLQDRVVVINSSDRTAVQSVQSNKIVFNSKPRFQVGDILVNEEGTPFLRQVTSVSPENSGYALSTKDATLSDVIQRGQLNFGVPVKLSRLLSSNFTARVKANGLKIENGKICLDDEGKNGFVINGCVGIDVNVKFEANFDFFQPQNSKVKIYGEIDGSLELEPKLHWRLSEVFSEELRFTFAATEVFQKIEIFGGNSFRIPIEIGPSLSLRLSASASETQSITEVGVSLFKLKLGLRGRLGVQNKSLTEFENVENSGVNPYYELTPPSVTFGISSEGSYAKAGINTKIGIGYIVKVFGKSNIELAVEPKIESNVEIKQSPNGFLGFRLDHHPTLKLWAGLRGAIDLNVWILTLSGGFDLGVETELAKWCGSIPPDGSVTVDPTTATLQANENKTLYASVNGYPFALTLDQSKCDLKPIWNSNGGILDPASDGLSATFRAASGGTYAVQVTNPSDRSKTATSTISVTAGPSGVLGGLVQDAVSRTPITGATVTVTANGIGEVGSTTTLADGTYSLQVPIGTGYAVTIGKSGYLPATSSNIEIIANQSRFLETLLFIESSRTGNGTLSGKITDSASGLGINAGTISLRSGLNVRSGLVVASTTTGSSGDYALSGVPAGYYTAEVGKTGYITGFFNVISVGDSTTSNQNFSISPQLSASELRIILTWGASPSDLDSHLTGPDDTGSRFHVYFSKKGPFTFGNTSAFLDVDDTSSYGPETVTLTAPGLGLYRYSIHDYSNRGSSSSTALAESSARVRVLSGASDTPLLDVNVPVGQIGNLWTVFEIENNQLRLVNTIGNVGSSLGVQSTGSGRSNDGSFLVDLPTK